MKQSIVAVTLCWVACSGSSSPPAAAPSPAPPSAPPAAAAPAESPQNALQKPEIVPIPPAGDLAAWFRAESTRAKSDGRQVVVYVGAKWCEPCERFKEALKSGALDAAFPRLRMLEADLDQHRDRLLSAGCDSRMIPLIALLEPDGRCGPRRLEGSVKGPGAVDNLRPRLAELLSTPSQQGPVQR